MRLIILLTIFVLAFVPFTPSSGSASDIMDETMSEYLRLGAEAQARGDYNEAMMNYNKAYSLGDRNPQVLNDLGILYEEIGVDARAEQFYLQAISYDSTYLPAYMNLAYLYLKYGQVDKAAQYFRHRYELAEPGDPWADKAVEELLKIKPGYKKWILKVQAEKLKKEILNKEHEDFTSKIALSRTHFTQGKKFAGQGEYKEAIIEYNKALSITPDNKEIKSAKEEAVMELTREQVREDSQQAMRLLEAGDTGAARTKFREILSTIPNNSGL